MAWPCTSVAAPWGGHDGKKLYWTPLHGKLVSSIVAVVQSLSSVWLCDPMDWGTPGFPVLHYHQMFAQVLLSQWCHPTILSSAAPFFSCLQSFPASGSFPMSQFFTPSGQSIRAWAWALAPVLPMNIQDWFPLALTDWISLQAKGLSKVFSIITIWKH